MEPENENSEKVANFYFLFHSFPITVSEKSRPIIYETAASCPKVNLLAHLKIISYIQSI